MAIEDLVFYQFKRKDYSYSSAAFLRDNGTYDRAALEKEARRQAKAMNQRLLRLEKAGLTSAPAYKGAVKAASGIYNKTDAVAWAHMSKGRPRYQESVSKLSDEELLNLLYATSKTSQAKTSTVGTVKKLYSAGLENLKAILKEAGGPSDLSINDMMKVFQSEAYKEAAKAYGYKAVVQAITDAGNRKTDGSPEDGVDALEKAISAYTKVYGKKPENILALRKAMGLDTQAVKPGLKWFDVN